MYSHRVNYPKKFGKTLRPLGEIPPQKYFPVFARVRIQAPHVFAKKLIPQEFFLHVLVLCRRVYMSDLLEAVMATRWGDIFKAQRDVQPLVTHLLSWKQSGHKAGLCDCKYRSDRLPKHRTQ